MRTKSSQQAAANAVFAILVASTCGRMVMVVVFRQLQSASDDATCPCGRQRQPDAHAPAEAEQPLVATQ